MFVFNFSNRSIMSSAYSVTQNLGLLRSLRFPRAILPISISVASTIAYGPILIVMLMVVLVDAGLHLEPSPFFQSSLRSKLSLTSVSASS